MIQWTWIFLDKFMDEKIMEKSFESQLQPFIFTKNTHLINFRGEATIDSRYFDGSICR